MKLRNWVIDDSKPLTSEPYARRMNLGKINPAKTLTISYPNDAKVLRTADFDLPPIINNLISQEAQ